MSRSADPPLAHTPREERLRLEARISITADFAQVARAILRNEADFQPKLATHQLEQLLLKIRRNGLHVRFLRNQENEVTTTNYGTIPGTGTQTTTPNPGNIQGYGIPGFNPLQIGAAPGDQKQLLLQQGAAALNGAVKNKDYGLLMQALVALSQLQPQDLAGLVNLLEPEVVQKMTEAAKYAQQAGPANAGYNNGGGVIPAANGGAGVQGAPDTTKANKMSAEQKANARTIIQVGREMGASDRDIQIALMTAMQESTMRNISHGDRDSVGLFQQRASQGWGTKQQIMDPRYSSKKFYEKLLSKKNRNNMSLAQAAQSVQISAFPDAYAKWQGLAAGLMVQLAGSGAKTALV